MGSSLRNSSCSFIPKLVSQDLCFLSKERHVIALETFSTISTIGLLIYVIRKYGTTVEPFADKPEQKSAQPEEVKQASIPHIQDATELEKSQQALVQKCHHLFDVHRNTAVALEVTSWERPYKVHKEVKNRLCRIGCVKRNKSHDEVVQKRTVQSISVRSKRRELQLPSAF